MVGLELFAEDTCVDILPLGCSPGRVVHTVGHIADVQFLRQIARIHRSEDVLAHFAVQPRNAVHFL